LCLADDLGTRDLSWAGRPEDAGNVAKLHNAVQAGDVNTVRAMLTSNPSLAMSIDEHKFQPIHLLEMDAIEKSLLFFSPMKPTLTPKLTRE
jgi:hypothetical protein